MKKAVIFDMDGLLIDSERITYEEYNKYLKNMGLEITLEIYQGMLGKTETQLREMFLNLFGKSFPIDQVWDDVHKNIDDRMLNDKTPVKPGCIELLTFLKKNDYKTIVATSSNRVRVDKLLKKAELAPYFDDSICGNEVSNGKPNPEIFLSACKKLDVSPQEAIVMEDSEAGILAANLAKIDVYCVPDMKYPSPDYALLTTKILHTCADLIDCLDAADTNISTH